MNEVETGSREKLSRGSAEGYGYLERLKRPALWLVVLLFVLAIVFYLLDIKASYDSTELTLFLNIVFVVLPSFLVAIIAARGFISTGVWPVLWMGIGTLSFGLAVLLSNWIRVWSSTNASATDYAILSLFAGLLHFLGSFFALSRVSPQEHHAGRLRTLLQVYLGALAFIAFITVVSAREILPPFVVQGAVSTDLRQMVLGTAALFFLLAGLMILRQSFKAKSAFLQWYGLGLILTCFPLIGNLLVVVSGTPFKWTTRGAQLFSGVYLLMAALVTFREARARQMPASEALASLFVPQEVNLQLLFDSVGDAIISTDTDFRITGWNKAAENIYSWKAEEVIGKDLYLVLKTRYPSGASMGEMRKRLLMENTGSTEVIHTRKDGKELNLLATANVQKNREGKPSEVVLVFHDITERKKAEEVLHQTRDYLENLFNYANAPIIVWDPEFKIARFNRAFEALTGHKAEEVLGRELDILFADDSREDSMEHIRRAMSGDRWEVVEIPIMRVDGTVRTVLWNSANVYTPDGKTVVSTIAQGQDITERKQMEEVLRESEGELSAILGSVPILTLLVDLERRVVKTNDAAAKFAGRRIEEMTGLRAGEALHCLHSLDDTRGCGFGPHCEVCKTRLNVVDTFQTGQSHYEVEWHLPFSRDGKPEEITFLLSTVLLETPKRQVLLCIEDITERKRNEEQLRIYERLATIGQLSGSIAHELRNPLATVDSSVYMLEKRLTDVAEPSRKYLERIKSGVSRCTAIIDALLNLTRTGEPQINPLELKAFIGDFLQNSRLPPTIEIIRESPREDVAVRGDPEQLNIAFRNIVTNAVQAMEGKGVLRVTIKADTDMTEMAFTDTGPGIPRANLKKLFQPLFTTKAKGIGLGLAIAKSIVEKHGGTIEAQSEEGHGATLIVRLPRCHDGVGAS